MSRLLSAGLGLGAGCLVFLLSPVVFFLLVEGWQGFGHLGCARLVSVAPIERAFRGGSWGNPQLVVVDIGVV